MNRLGQGELAEGGAARHFTLTSQGENDSWATFISYYSSLTFTLLLIFEDCTHICLVNICYMLFCFVCFIALIFCVTLLHCTSILYYVSFCFIALVSNILCSLAWFAQIFSVILLHCKALWFISLLASIFVQFPFPFSFSFWYSSADLVNCWLFWHIIDAW